MQIAAAVLLILVFGGGWLAWSLYRGTAAHYVTQKIERGPIVRSVTTSGVIGLAASTPVRARVSGVIQALYCDTNTRVNAGHLCAKIDPRPYQIVVDHDKADLLAGGAQLERDKANLDQAQTAFERNQIRAKRRAITRKALDNSRKVYEQAQTQIKRDEATVAELETALQAAEINLGDTEIVSPIDGTVISRNVEVGQTVAAGSETPPLFLVAADLTVIHVDANAGGKDIGEVKPGDKASFTVEAYPNRRFAGEVTQIRPLPQAIENVATYDLVISAPNPNLLLKPGMTAMIQIVVDSRDDVLRAPTQALRYTPRDLAVPNGSGGPRVPPDGSPQLWILRDGKPTAITIQLGLDDGAYTEIVKGDLQPGDELIIRESGDVLEKPAAMVPPDPRLGKPKS